MDTKLPPTFWTDPQFDECDTEILCAILWIKTNDRLNLLGFAEIGQRLFEFQTRMPFACFERACQALGKGLLRDGQSYWLRDFVREQIGSGEALAKNHMRKPLVRALATVGSPSILAAIRNEYPELLESDFEKGLPSPCQGPEQSRAEQSRVEQSRAETEGGQGETLTLGENSNGSSRRSRATKSGSTRPADHAEPMRSRMIAVAAVMNRRPDSVWNEPEKKAFESAGLRELCDEDFTDQVEAMRRFYRAKIPPGKDRTFWKRSTLPILLNNWPSELDKARAWCRDASPEGDGVTVINPQPKSA